MIRSTAVVLLLIAGVSMPAFAADDLVAEPEVHKLAGGMKFIEGPVWTNDEGGYLIFSDIPSNELKKWTSAGGLVTFRNPSNHANGNTRDQEGRLICCEHSAHRVTRTEKDGSITVLADSFEGKKLNSPNDVVVKSDGMIYFTDPTYGLNDAKAKQEMPGQYVFRLNPETKELVALIKDFEQPNGLCFSPDEKRLYIADSHTPRHIRVFDVTDKGLLESGRVFCTIDKGVPDGIRCDAKGNVWSSAGDGIQIIDPSGKLIHRIRVPESPANLAFGGEDSKTLFITARNSLYSIRTNVAGATRRARP